MPQATPVSTSRNSQCKGSCNLERAPKREPRFCRTPLDFLWLSPKKKHGPQPTLNATASYHHHANKVEHKSCKARARAQRTRWHSGGEGRGCDSPWHRLQVGPDTCAQPTPGPDSSSLISETGFDSCEVRGGINYTNKKLSNQGERRESKERQALRRPDPAVSSQRQDPSIASCGPLGITPV